MIFVHDLQSSRRLQQWFKLSSVLQFLDIISSSDKLASNEHPWNLEIKHNIHKLSNTCSPVQWVVEPGVSRSREVTYHRVTVWCIPRATMNDVILILFCGEAADVKRGYQ